MKTILIAIASTVLIHAAEPEAKTFKDPSGREVLYRFSAPEKIDEGRKYPLVLFLHGAGERGTDNTAQMKHGVRAIIAGAEKLDEPVFLIAPQCPPEQWWSEPKEDRMELRDAGGKNSLIEAVLSLIAETAKDHPIDPDRIYVTGLSMGGFGTFELLARTPETWAAAIPICGAGDPNTAEKFKDVPVHIFHGGADDVVPPAGSQIMFDALQKAGAKNAKVTLYPGVGHDSWTQTYADPEVIKWLFAQKKAD